MPANAYLNNMHIEKEIRETGAISDADLNTMLAMLNTSESTDPALVRSRVLYTLHFLKNIPISQSEKIYNATVPLLSGTPEYAATLNKTAGAMMMGVLKDKRAIPYLLPLLHDKDWNVQDDAKTALQKIGYMQPS